MGKSHASTFELPRGGSPLSYCSVYSTITMASWFAVARAASLSGESSDDGGAAGRSWAWHNAAAVMNTTAKARGERLVITCSLQVRFGQIASFDAQRAHRAGCESVLAIVAGDIQHDLAHQAVPQNRDHDA